jgi:hypothetical protein
MIGLNMSMTVISSEVALASDLSGTRSVLAEEHIGPFRHGLPSKEVTRLLGAPEQLTIGEQSEEWNYSRKGIRLTIGKDPMGTWVKQVSVTAPSKLESARGAHIGTLWKDLLKLYSDGTIPPGFSTDWYWVGSVKAGIGFKVGNGKISRMVLGEAPPECIEPTIGGSRK